MNSLKKTTNLNSLHTFRYKEKAFQNYSDLCDILLYVIIVFPSALSLALLGLAWLTFAGCCPIVVAVSPLFSPKFPTVFPPIFPSTQSPIFRPSPDLPACPAVRAYYWCAENVRVIGMLTFAFSGRGAFGWGHSSIHLSDMTPIKVHPMTPNNTDIASRPAGKSWRLPRVRHHPERKRVP